MKSLITIGEGMAELRMGDNGELVHSFAGDTVNAAIYAKRFAPAVDVTFLSAVGEDFLSDGLFELLKKESVRTDDIVRTDIANIGIYAIQTDEHGERSFRYWRKGSAASQMMSLIGDAELEALPADSLIFFSGISLAILSDEDKEKLLEALAKLKANGATLAFDPNYRPALWRDEEHASTWFAKGYAIADIALPGLDEHEDLFGQKTTQDVLDYMSQFSLSELVIKCGKEGVFSYDMQGGEWHQPFNPAPKQIDSTSAGDSFAGTYFASRIKGCSIAESVANADAVARLVVQHKGAIIDVDAYNAEFGG